LCKAVIDVTGKPHPFTAADMTGLPQRTLKAKAHGVENEFTGVSLVDLLQSAGVEFGEKLCGDRACDVVILDAADGYRTVFALLEIDPATTDKLVLVADKKDGKPLDDKEGPYRLVVPDEKRPVRWQRMVKTIHVVNLKDLPPMHSIPVPSDQHGP
jgi:DMSO/TMAO reductase YedYZ molybdopterin-dependent catalytic subunit